MEQTEELGHALAEQLFGSLEENDAVFAVLDGASIPELLDNLYTDEPPEFECLLRGELAPDIAEVAPYLVDVERDSAVAKWLFDKGWGEHWGVFAVAQADLPTMRRHLQSLLTVHDADGHPMFFRYYDPRVLRVYLPTCTAAEIATFFGPIRSFTLEDGDPKTALRFRHVEGNLETDKLPLSKAAG